MDTPSSHLPWNDLNHTKGTIPWPVLRTFSEAVAADREVVERLFRIYEEAHEKALRETCYADLYVPAILAMAALRLSDEQRREISSFLIEKLAAAGRDDDDLGLEVLTAAVGAMGPIILPAVLETIAKEPDTRGAWVFLWSLTMLALETDDPALRNLVIEACVDLLERIDQGQGDLGDGPQAAWTLASLKCVEHAALLQRLTKKAAGRFLLGDYEEAMKLMQGQRQQSPLKELWERPVEEWLRAQWKAARDWYAKRQKQEDTEYDEEKEENARLERVDRLAAEFVKSSAAKDLPPQFLEDAGFIVHCVLSYGITHLGVEVEDLGGTELRELLLEIVPRKVTATKDLLEKVAPITAAFLEWAGCEGLTGQGDALAAKVRHWTDKIVRKGMDPTHWGPAKTFVMGAEEAGIDVTDREAVQRYIEQQSLGLLGEEDSDWDTVNDYAPPIPIVSHEPKIGRNDPCPCGSGKKYKKCCGNPAKPQKADL